MGMETEVEALQGLTDSPDVVEALVDCDVIFGCVDFRLWQIPFGLPGECVLDPIL